MAQLVKEFHVSKAFLFNLGGSIISGGEVCGAVSHRWQGRLITVLSGRISVELTPYHSQRNPLEVPLESPEFA